MRRLLTFIRYLLLLRRARRTGYRDGRAGRVTRDWNGAPHPQTLVHQAWVEAQVAVREHRLHHKSAKMFAALIAMASVARSLAVAAKRAGAKEHAARSAAEALRAPVVAAEVEDGAESRGRVVDPKFLEWSLGFASIVLELLMNKTALRIVPDSGPIILLAATGVGAVLFVAAKTAGLQMWTVREAMDDEERRQAAARAWLAILVLAGTLGGLASLRYTSLQQAAAEYGGDVPRLGLLFGLGGMQALAAVAEFALGYMRADAETADQAAARRRRMWAYVIAWLSARAATRARERLAKARAELAAGFAAWFAREAAFEQLRRYFSALAKRADAELARAYLSGHKGLLDVQVLASMRADYDEVAQPGDALVLELLERLLVGGLFDADEEDVA